VLAAAQERNEIAVGYRLLQHAKDAAQNYGVAVNPKKSEMVTFSRDDRIIVLAES
jgi:hypothetical protein